MGCRRINEQIHAYLDDCLPPREAQAVVAHLDACARCRAELERMQRSLSALRAAAPAEPAPDLWPALRARIEASLPALDCERARAWLLECGDGSLSPSEASALQRHLAACAACAAEHRSLQRAIAALERLPVAEAPVDLWPALRARLTAAPIRRWGWRWMWQPAVALAAAVVAFWVWRGPLSRPATPAATIPPPDRGVQRLASPRAAVTRATSERAQPTRAIARARRRPRLVAAAARPGPRPALRAPEPEAPVPAADVIATAAALTELSEQDTRQIVAALSVVHEYQTELDDPGSRIMPLQ